MQRAIYNPELGILHNVTMRGNPALWPRATLRPVLTEEERKARLAYAIRAAREARGMTPPQLAAKLSRQRGTVNKWESGESAPSLLDLGPLCDALSVDAKLFAELPAIPASPVAEYLVERTVAEALVEARTLARRPRAAEAPSGPRRQPTQPPPEGDPEPQGSQGR